MPSQSGKQHRFMEMVAHDPAAAQRVGVPGKVGKDFVAADKKAGKKFNGPSQMAKAHALRNLKVRDSDGDGY